MSEDVQDPGDRSTDLLDLRDSRGSGYVNRYVGNLAPTPGVFPDYPAQVIRNNVAGTDMTMMRWGMLLHCAPAGRRSPTSTTRHLSAGR
jgi:hypothetical protein